MVGQVGVRCASCHPDDLWPQSPQTTVTMGSKFNLSLILVYWTWTKCNTFMFWSFFFFLDNVWRPKILFCLHFAVWRRAACCCISRWQLFSHVSFTPPVPQRERMCVVYSGYTITWPSIIYVRGFSPVMLETNRLQDCGHSCTEDKVIIFTKKQSDWKVNLFEVNWSLKVLRRFEKKLFFHL